MDCATLPIDAHLPEIARKVLDFGALVLQAEPGAGKTTRVPAALLGYSGGPSLIVKGLVSLELSDIKAAHEAWLPGYMSATE